MTLVCVFDSLQDLREMAACFKASARQLILLLLVVCVTVILFASAMFYAEKDVTDTNFTSIPSLCFAHCSFFFWRERKICCFVDVFAVH